MRVLVFFIQGKVEIVKAERWRLAETKKGMVASDLAPQHLLRIKWMWGPWGKLGPSLWETSLTKYPAPKSNRQWGVCQNRLPSKDYAHLNKEHTGSKHHGGEPPKFYAAHNFLDPSGNWGGVGEKTLHTHWDWIFLNPSEKRTESQLQFNFFNWRIKYCAILLNMRIFGSRNKLTT